MHVAGAPLWKILAAGEWRSPAFLEYMDIHRLENDVVVQVSRLLPSGHESSVRSAISLSRRMQMRAGRTLTE